MMGNEGAELRESNAMATFEDEDQEFALDMDAYW